MSYDNFEITKSIAIAKNFDLRDDNKPEIGESFRELTRLIYDPTVSTIILQGGSNAGKTFNVMGVLLLMMLAGEYPELQETGEYKMCPRKFRITIAGMSLDHIKSGAEEDFQVWLSAYFPVAVEQEAKYRHKSRNIYTINGSRLRFRAVESGQKAKGIKQEITYINEADGVPLLVFRELNRRTRLKMIIDYNPTAEFWAHALIGADGVAFRIWNYLRNIKHLDARTLADFEYQKKHNPDDYHVYGLGYTGKVKGLVYPNVELVNDFPEISELQFPTLGVDFGANDPTAVVLVGLYKGKLYAKELIYKPIFTDTELKDALFEVLGDPKINSKLRKIAMHCDHQPTKIVYLQQIGFSARSAKKAEMRKAAGVALVRSLHPCICFTSANMIREAKTLKYEDSKATGEPTDKLKDGNDHAMDALLYATLGEPNFLYFLTNTAKTRR